MSVDLSPAAAAGTAGGTATPSGVAGQHGVGSLGSDAFLKLLVVQLQNQDPTSPQSNTEFIAQLAQFSALEQLASINQSVTALVQFFAAIGGAAKSAGGAPATEGKV